SRCSTANARRDSETMSDMTDETYFNALVRMFEQALNTIANLSEADRGPLIARLDRQRAISQGFGCAVGDDMDPYLPIEEGGIDVGAGDDSALYRHRFPLSEGRHKPVQFQVCLSVAQISLCPGAGLLATNPENSTRCVRPIRRLSRSDTPPVSATHNPPDPA